MPEDWAATGELHYPDATGQYPKVISKALEGMTHAGIAVVAKDTGRVYLQQRRFTHPKKAGIWEFPAGTLDPNENLFEGAKREWEEEVNLTLPKGELIDSWIVDHFIGFVWLIENQDAIPSTHRPHNPEVSGNVLWIDPSEALSLENLREELKSFDWDRLKINSKQTVDVQ